MGAGRFVDAAGGTLWSAGLALAIGGAAAASGCSGGETAPTGGGGASSSSSAASSTTSTGGGGGAPLPRTFEISGRVVDRDGKPVAGAIVMQGGGPIPDATTGADGKYRLRLGRDIPGTPTAIAAKIGYRSGGVELGALPEGPVDITMIEAKGGDNLLYHYGDPGTGDAKHDDTTQYCGHCHTTFAAQFQTSMHAQAAKDPLVLDLYAGASEAFTDRATCEAGGGAWLTGRAPGQPTQSKEKCYVGRGVLPDLNVGCASATSGCDDPAASTNLTAFGACADCHAAGIEGPLGGQNLLAASGIAFADGNHCDVCHHVSDVDLTKPAGTAGALVVHRSSDHTVEGQFPPAPIVQIMYGPLPDVANSFMGGSWQPKFKSAELCGGCHEQTQPALVPGTSLDAARWPDGLPTHSTYSEWKDWGIPSSPCQTCHMPPDESGLTNTVDVTRPNEAGITFGFVRPASDIRQHVFRHPLSGTPRFIDSAVGLSASGTTTATDVVVSVQAVNANAGHAIPTGEPMRSLVLVVSAEACGAALVPSGGMTISDVGGAMATGTAGVDVMVNGASLTWSAGAAAAKIGDVVRAVRPSGQYEDYAGLGFFSNPALSAAEKGIEVRAPVGQAKVVGDAGGVLALDAALPLASGDLVYLGDVPGASFVDGASSLALAGAPGQTFSRVLVDASGERNVPHYRAVDIASDNRLPPQGDQRSEHTFARPTGCARATVRATLLYRPAPVGEARLRGWAAKDFVIAETTEDVALP